MRREWRSRNGLPRKICAIGVLLPAALGLESGRMTARRAAFTLLEICLVLMIAVIILLLAVPSISGMLADQRLHESYSRFERFVDDARLQTLRDQKPVILIWDKQGISMCKAERDPKGAPVVVDRMEVSENEVFDLGRPAALAPKPAAEWTFWPNGTCEPVVVSYKGPAGVWQVSFDALTARGTFLNSESL